METKIEPLLVQVLTEESVADAERDIRAYTDEALRTQPDGLSKEISLRFSTAASPSYNLAIGLAFATERAREAYEKLVLPWLDRKYKIEVITAPLAAAPSEDGKSEGNRDLAEPFSSLDELISVHTALLESEAEANVDKVKEFIKRGVRTGTRLDNTDERRTAQSLLNYWVTVLYRLKSNDNTNAILAFYVPPAHLGFETSACPYIGLSPYREEDHDSFFGRDVLTSAIVERLQEKRLVVLVGPSGSGKTSVLNAGVLPKLKNNKDLESYPWRYYPAFTPGSDPLKSLATVLTDDVEAAAQKLAQQPDHLIELMKDPHSETPGVLVIDQFEEVFTTCKDDQARDKFLSALLSIKESPIRHRLILLMRSDQVNQFIRRPALNEIYREAEIRIYPLRENELYDVIKKPADKIGLRFESGVIEQLMREIFGDPVGLPLLQFALLELWADRDCEKITWGAMNRLGTCRDALVRKAEQFYAGLSEDEKKVTRHILLRMVRLSDTWEAATESVRLVDLYQPGEDREPVNLVLRKLLEANLARISNLHCRPTAAGGEVSSPNVPVEISDDYQFELAHQSLARYWPKITEWFNDLRESLVIKRRLELYASNWGILGHAEKGLLDNYQLHEAETWLASDGARELGYDPDVQALTLRSRQAINHRRRIASLTVAGLVTVIIIVIFLLIRSEHQRLKGATSSRLALTADMLKDQDLDLALLLSLEALQRNKESSAVQNSLMRVATHSPNLRAFLDTKGNTAREIRFSSDGQKLFALDESRQRLRSWDLTSRKPGPEIEIPLTPKTPQGDSTLDQFPLLSPDGSYLLFVDDRGNLVGRNTQTTETPQIICESETKLESQFPVAYSNDSSKLVWGKPSNNPKPGEETELTIQDLKGQKRLFSTGVPRLSAVAFTPDDKTLAGITPATEILLFSVEQDKFKLIGKLLASPLRESSKWSKTAYDGTGSVENPRLALRIAFSGDSQRLALLYPNNVLAVWSLKDQTQIARFSRSSTQTAAQNKPQRAHSEGDYKTVSYFSLDNTGRQLVAGYNDGSIVFWDVGDGRKSTDTPKPPKEYTSLHHTAVTEIAFSPDDNMLITFSDEEFPTLWTKSKPLGNGNEFDTRSKLITGHNQAITKVAFAPKNNKLIAAAGDAGVVALWNLEQQIPAEKLAPSQTGDPRRVTSDGRLFVLGDKDEIRIFNVNADKKDVNAGKEIDKFSIKLDWLPAENNIIDFFVDRQGTVLVALYHNPISEGDTIRDANTIGVWDLRTRTFKGPITPLADKNEYGSYILGMALDAEGKLLAVASINDTSKNDDTSKNKGHISLWSVETRKPTSFIDYGEARNVTITLSADGTRLASSDSNGVVKIWDTSTAKTIREDIKTGTQSFQLEFTQDGSELLINRDNYLSSWETKPSNKPGDVPLWKTNGIEGITQNPVRKEVAAATTSDGSIVFLNLDNGKEQFRLDASELQKLGSDRPTAAMYSPDGNRLIVGYSDRSISSIRLDLDTWTERACTMANRQLSLAEKDAHNTYEDRALSYLNPWHWIWPEPPICPENEPKQMTAPGPRL